MNQSNLAIGVLVIAHLCFGINFALTKGVLNHVGPGPWAALRMLVAGLVLLGAAVALKRPRPVLSQKFCSAFILFGGVWALHQALQVVAMSKTTASNAAAFHTLAPIFTVMIVAAMGIESLNRNKILGIGLAFAGALLVRWSDGFSLSDQTVLGDILAASSALCLAVFFANGKKLLAGNDLFWTLGGVLLLGGVMVAVISLASHGLPDLSGVIAVPGLALASIVIGAIIPISFNFWAIKIAPPSLVALIFYVQPVVGVGLAWAWLGESLGVLKVAAVLLIISGITIGRRPAR